MKIVVVEDDEPIRAMYQYKLKSAGFEVYNASNGIIGLTVIERQRPHLILLDLKMPVMGGTEMLQILRAKAWAASIRVIILTNISKTEAPTELRFLNVDRYIVKVHYTPQQVVDIVKEVLRI